MADINTAITFFKENIVLDLIILFGIGLLIYHKFLKKPKRVQEQQLPEQFPEEPPIKTEDIIDPLNTIEDSLWKLNARHIELIKKQSTQELNIKETKEEIESVKKEYNKIKRDYDERKVRGGR